MVLFDIVKMKLENWGIIGGIGVCSKHCASSKQLYGRSKKKRLNNNLAFCYLDDADSQIQLFVMELMQCATMANTQNDHIR